MIEEIRPVVIKKYEFERGVENFFSTFGYFGLSEFRGKKQKEMSSQFNTPAKL